MSDYRYDVFVSFKGEIRDGFLSHLIEAFKRNQINAFVDERLEKGEEVGPSLGIIEGSSISLIILSQGYVYSRRCLEELVTILECREKYGQTIIPVFYEVEPTDVGHQSSESYIDAFAKHEKKHESEVQKWRDALKTTANIPGIVSSNQNDAELVEEIVNLVVNSAPQIKYDVFVSYRSEICRRFLSHLVDTFKIKKINAFIVDKLESRTSPVEAVEAIEASSVSLIIFSPNYASSYWCLEELVTILKCKQKYGRIVIPVFYNVEPTHVQHQSSHKYKNAFAKHGEKHKSKVQIWGDALKQSADLSRIESSKFQNDAELLKEIVNLVQVVLTMFDKPQCGSSKGFVGIDARIERPRISKSKRLIAIDKKVATVETLIRTEPEGEGTRRVIGIWGMGGIGKTTLAKKVFNKLKSGYNGSCFLADEGKKSKNSGITSLKKFIFSKLLGCNDVEIEESDCVPDHIVSKTRGMKVLIVLDDVDDPKHPEQLLGTRENFAPGSRIIITTRDMQVLQTSKANETYQLTELSSDEALELFHSKDFDQRDDQWEYNDLSKRVVHYAKGIPLVIEVLASYLRGNKKEVLESVLDKIENMFPKEVYEVMIRSYDCLDSEKQKIFLDLACFFLRSHHKIYVSDLVFLLKDDESSNSVVSDLARLKQKALITLSEDNCVSMHDILQEMALKIVRGEPIKNPSSRSRLWDPKDIYEVLKSGKVSEDIRSIQIDFSEIKELKSIPEDIFAKMSRLQFLEISGIYKYDLIDPHCILGKRLQSLPSELRFLHWDRYPLQSLPENFSVERLVILSLRLGKMEELWDGMKNLVNLKVVDVSGSWKLKKLPDLSKATNLEVLNACTCESLLTIGKLPHSLKNLDVNSCTSLYTLPKLPLSLETLNAGRCESLLTLGELPFSLKNLDVNSCTSLRTLPEELPPLLETLNASRCELLYFIGMLPYSLENLDVNSCTSLHTLLKLPLSLETLNAGRCESLLTLGELPNSLKNLDVNSCTSLQTLPELPPLLETLNAGWCESLHTIGKLPHSLKTLDVYHCTSLQALPELPPSLETLNAGWCESLHTIGKLPHSLKTLDVYHCTSLQTLPELPPLLETLNGIKANQFGMYGSFRL